MKNKIKKFLEKGNISNQGNRKNAGITLVALVVTIVILVILAGITIASLTKENGLINKVVQASKENEIQKIQEHIKIIIDNIQIEKIGNATLQDLINALHEDTEYEYEIVLGEIATIKRRDTRN